MVPQYGAIKYIAASKQSKTEQPIIFLGVGRKTPLTGVQGDMGWKMSEHRSWLSVAQQWCRWANMDYEQVNRKIFVWSERLARNGRRNVHRKMISYFEDIGMNNFSNINQIGQYGEIMADLDLVLSEFYEYKWYQKVSSETGVNRTGRNKLRTYKNFKREHSVEHYVKAPLPRGEKSAMAKFRVGVAPIKLETGCYTRTPEDERLCVLCQLNEIE